MAGLETQRSSPYKHTWGSSSHCLFAFLFFFFFFLTDKIHFWDCLL